MSTRTIARSVSRPSRSRASASTSGSSGMGPNLSGPESSELLPPEGAEAHNRGVSAVAPLPEGVEYFLDARGDQRALRVTWHHEADLVVLSMWRGPECVSSFRLAVEEVPDLIRALRAGLDDAYVAA